MMIDWNTWA